MKFVIDKDIDDITIKDIEYLVENQIQEGISLDYKMKNYEATSGSKKELLKDVTAFANSSGGDLIIGVEDDKYNQAKTIVGIETNNIAVDVNRIEQVIYNGIEPKLDTVKVRYLEYKDGKYIIIIRVGASPLFPHMVSFQKTNKFYIRKSDKNILLDAYELKNIFLKSENINQNIKNENKKIINKVYSNETILPLDVISPKLIINFIPYNLDRNIKNLQDIKLDFPEQRINFDGVLGYKTNQNGVESYCQLYRNGIIEFVSTTNKIFLKIQNPYNTLKKEEINVISGNKNGYEYFIIKKCIYFFNFLKKLNVELPIYMFITILDAKGYRIFYNNGNSIKLTNSIDRDMLELPEIELKYYDIDIKKAVKDIINMIWNACGVEKSTNFDSNGNWLGDKIEN